jgi:hypothetical protein
MRFLIATGLFVVSVVLLMVGLGQRTIWAAPVVTTYSLSNAVDAPFLVIPNSAISARPGSAALHVSSNGSLLAVTGRESDIHAWLGRERNALVGVDAKRGLLTQKLQGALDSKISPAGSDLWRSESLGNKKLDIVLSRGSQNAVLVSSDGIGGAANKVSLTWTIDRDVSLSTALLIAGGVLLIVAFVFNALAISKNRKIRGPRRRLPKPPQGPKYKVKRNKSAAPARGRHRARRGGRALGSIAVASLAIGALAGCAPAQPTTAVSASASPAVAAQAPPAITRMQLDRILANVVAVTTAADSREDKKTLRIRFAGPALALRTVNYKLRKLWNRTTPMPSIAESPVTFLLPQSTSSWPRTVMVVTEDKASHSLPQLLVLRQKQPRDNYKVWYTIPLLPGAKIPAVPLASAGAISIAPDSLFLKLKPQNLAFAFGDLINKGTASQFASKFDVANNAFYNLDSSNQKSVKASLKSATVRFEHSLGDQHIESLATTDGGALVAVYMLDDYIVKAKKSGSAVTVTGEEQKLLKATGSITGVKSTYGNMLLFYVPPSSAPTGIQLLGASQGILAVKNL